MKLISWNVAARERKQSQQADALLSLEPDIIALQEVTAGTLPLWSQSLDAHGFGVLHSGHDAAGSTKFNLVASASTIDQLPTIAREFPRGTLSATVHLPPGNVQLHNAHVVNGSSNDLRKIDMLEAISKSLAVAHDGHRILCGDFNLPFSESETGDVVTWAHKHRKKDRPRWEAAERAVLLDLADHDLGDAYRGLYGYEAKASSWVPSSGERRTGRRFDHVFASASLGVQSVRYLGDWRTGGLSDHAAVEAVFAPA